MKTAILRVSVFFLILLGLDEDCNIKCFFIYFILFWGCIILSDFYSDQTIIAHHSTVEAKTQTSTAQNGYICKDSSNASPSNETPSTASYLNTTLYCRDKNRKYKPGETVW